MGERRFQRRVENFVCENCEEKVVGDGYTNHCPKCLWSKHVDVNPGDRAAQCGGMMKPESVEGTSPDYRIIYKCEECGFSRPNAVHKDDNMQAVLAIAGNR